MPISRFQKFIVTVTLFLMTLSGDAAHAQTVRLLHAFNTISDGAYPSTRVTQTPDGTIYGATTGGGVMTYGTLFKITADGAFKTIYNFGATQRDGYSPRDGANPSGALAVGPDNAVYGTTEYGGSVLQGAVFRIGSYGAVTTIYRFSNFGHDANTPVSGLMYDPYDHFLYGASSGGGFYGCGTIFKVSATGEESVVTSFTAATANVSRAPLVFNPADHLLYGTTIASGGHGQDAVYTISTAGVFHVLKVLDKSLGVSPEGGLTLAPDGALYGVTSAGGLYGGGTIYKIANGQFSAIYNFAPGAGGSKPKAPMLAARDGALYGTTSEAHGQPYGGIFRLTLGAKPAVVSVYDFTDGHESADPGAVFQAANGLLYLGSYGVSGNNMRGSIFKVSTGGAASVIADLKSGLHDAWAPMGALIAGPQGYLYGVSQNGGSLGSGAIFHISLQGAEQTLSSLGPDSGLNSPRGGLVLGPDGVLYGTASYGIGNNRSYWVPEVAGGVYSYSVAAGTQGAVASAVYSFQKTDGACPAAALIFGADGNLYGTTRGDLLGSKGTVFKISRAGSLQTLAEFTSASTGLQPTCTLVQGPDGTLYGTTSAGGSNGFGTVFAITPQGAFQWSRSLTAAQGKYPYEGLVFGPDGLLYGTAQQGGANDKGTIYKVTTTGVVSTVYSFQWNTGNTPCARLTLGPDHAFYGSTTTGVGSSYGGTLFRLKNNAVTYLANLGGELGAAPVASLTLAADGNFYGVTSAGGKGYGGTVFALDVEIPTVQVFSPTSAAPGTTITIGGTNFATASRVTINGAPTSFTRVSDTRVTAIVPNGSQQTGKITVTAAGGTATSAETFTNTSAQPPL